MKHLFVLLSTAISFFSFGQNYENIAIKEKYDILNQQLIASYSTCTIDPNNDAKTFGDGLSKVLEGYIIMYKTTKDKAYLYKFIIQSICVMENRHDFVGINSDPRWSWEPLMYEDGYIIASMSHFVYLIKKEEPELINLKLYPFPKIINNEFGITFTTFGQFANWLDNKVKETLDWYVSEGYWKNSWGFQQYTDARRAAILNQQAGFAITLLFLGISNSNSNYLEKAYKIAGLIKGNVHFYDECKNKFYASPVLQLGSNNSYWWYDNGWSIPTRDCWKFIPLPPYVIYLWNIPNYDGYTSYIEDLSHGAIDSWLFYYYFLYLPNSPLTENDMIRFHNTFTQNINKDGYLHTGVDGSFNTALEGREDYNYHKINLLKKCCSIAFMPFYRWDNCSNAYGSVYDETMNYFLTYFNSYDIIPPYYYGQANLSHAFVVQAQWDKECPNLTLYNRKVVYDQDFFSKSTLTVAPQESQGDSYADPTIQDKTFTVEPGVTVNMRAAKSIVLKPGTQIKAGSYFHAYIDPSLCSNSKNNKNIITDNSILPKENIQEESTDQTKIVEENTLFDVSLNIYPNPFSEQTLINFSLPKTSKVTLKVIDSYGKILFNKITDKTLSEGIYNIPFIGKDLPDGFYFCILIVDNKTFTKKIIKQ